MLTDHVVHRKASWHKSLLASTVGWLSRADQKNRRKLAS